MINPLSIHCAIACNLLGLGVLIVRRSLRWRTQYRRVVLDVPPDGVASVMGVVNRFALGMSTPNEWRSGTICQWMRGEPSFAKTKTRDVGKASNDR